MPFSDRLDLVIFGASGYTGKHVVKELARIGRSYPEITWAVSGRNRNKLETVLQEVSKKTGDNLSRVKIITADVNDEASIRAMCGQAKVVVNCCGPYVKYGEVVVAAAIANKSHYVDVAVETRFLELVEEKYDKAAREAGVFVVTACGLCSIPVDLGLLFLEQNFGGTLNSVESYLITEFPSKMVTESWRNGIVRYSSWESMINSMAYKVLPQSSNNLVPELKSRCLIHRNLNKWCCPFPSADTYVINQTQRHLLSLDDKRPVQYKPYIAFNSIFTAIGLIIGWMLLFVLTKISLTKRFLLNHPKLCSLGLVTYGDTKEGVMDDSYFQYEMIGRGWDKGTDLGKTPDKKVVARISVSGLNPAYVATAAALIFAAITILKEEDKLPSRRGVLTPGVVFRKTSILKYLQDNDFKFEIIKNPK